MVKQRHRGGRKVCEMTEHSSAISCTKEGHINTEGGGGLKGRRLVSEYTPPISHTNLLNHMLAYAPPAPGR